MEKQDILLKMMEQPEKYSDQQWQEILDDPDCRRLYDMISLTGSVVAAKASTDRLTDDDIFLEWEKLEMLHKAKTVHLRRWKVAAVIMAVVCFTGLAVAAVTNHWLSPKQEQPKVEQKVVENKEVSSMTALSSDTAKTAKPDLRQPKTFVNVSLQDILTELSAYYHVELVWKNEQAKQLRLYFEWNPQDDIDKIANKLNNFQSIQLSVENGKLIVE